LGVSRLSLRLLKSLSTVGINTLLSRILGFVRDIVVAGTFGAGVGADAFFVAFRIPNFLRRLFAEGAFSQAFVPVLSEYKAQRAHHAVMELSAHVAGTLGLILVGVTVAGVVAAPLLVSVFAPGFVGHEDKFALTVSMLRITFPYLLFISLTSLAAGMLNTYGRFGVPAFTPVLLNLSLIGAAIWLAPLMDVPVVALAWGVFLGGILQLAFQLPFLFRLRLLPRPRYRRAHEGVRRIMKLIVPALFGVSVAQINLLVDTVIASFLVTGSVSWLYFSDRLVEFPLGVFGIALATVILPSLSQKHASGSREEFSSTLDWALRWVLLIGLPASVGLVILAGPMLTTLFHYGAFGAEDVRMASLSLMAYATGLLGFVFIKVLAPGYYARQDMRSPVRIGVVAMTSNMVFNIVLVFPLAHAGLALATSLSAFVNAVLLYRGLRQKAVYRPCQGWTRFSLQIAFGNLLMALVLWSARGDLASWLAFGVEERIARLTLLILMGALVYFLSLAAVGLRPRSLVFAEGR
jgi:putative peptidoglycan lipid II flippase